MKRNISIKTYLWAIITGCIIALSACQEEGISDPKPGNNPNDTTNTHNDNGNNNNQNTADANEISADLILQGFTPMHGSIPASSNAADLKLDKDTLFLVEGIQNRIRILYPPNFQVGSVSFYVQVAGADQYFDIEMEYISFKEDGTMIGQLIEQTQNIDPSESDFCKREPEYIRRTNNNVFWGEYTYNSSNRSVEFTTIESTEREIYLDALDLIVYEYDRYYISPFFDYEIVSCHFLLETSNMEGQERQRLFERRETIVNGEKYALWYD